MKQPGLRIGIPLVVLALFSLSAGFIDLPSSLGNFPLLSDFLHNTLPALELNPPTILTEPVLQIIAGIVSIGGVFFAYLAYLRNPQILANLKQTRVGRMVYTLWFYGWGFDWLDNELVVQPFVWLARKDRNDVIDRFYQGAARVSMQLSKFTARSQTGRLHLYLMGIVFGAVLTIALVVLR